MYFRLLPSHKLQLNKPNFRTHSCHNKHLLVFLGSLSFFVSVFLGYCEIEAFIHLIPFVTLDSASMVIFTILWCILFIQATGTQNPDSETVRGH